MYPTAFCKPILKSIYCSKIIGFYAYATDSLGQIYLIYLCIPCEMHIESQIECFNGYEIWQFALIVEVFARHL